MATVSPSWNGPADPRRSTRVLGSAPRVERVPQPVGGVLWQAAVLAQRPEPEGVVDAEETGEGVIGVSGVEEGEVDGGVPHRVLVALSPDPGQGPALDHSAHVGGHVRSLRSADKARRPDFGADRTTAHALPRNTGFVNAANAPGSGPTAVSCRNSARTYAA